MMSSLQAQAVIQHVCFMLPAATSPPASMQPVNEHHGCDQLCSMISGAQVPIAALMLDSRRHVQPLRPMRDLVTTFLLCAACTGALKTSASPGYAPCICTNAWPGFANP